MAGKFRNGRDVCSQLLAQVHNAGARGAWDVQNIEFEMYDGFRSASDTNAWLRAWSGNKKANAKAFRVFGQDGSGGIVALWCVHDDRSMELQPVVFLGSEGELGVVGVDLADFVTLLGCGIGPAEAVGEGADAKARPVHELRALAARWFGSRARRTSRQIIAAARKMRPGLAELVDGWTRGEALAEDQKGRVLVGLLRVLLKHKHYDPDIGASLVVTLIDKTYHVKWYNGGLKRYPATDELREPLTLLRDFIGRPLKGSDIDVAPYGAFFEKNTILGDEKAVKRAIQAIRKK